MTANTNFYDIKKKAGIEGRDWKPVVGAELRSWIGILIYMGVCRMPAIEGYSKHDGFYPTNISIFFILMHRKRFFMWKESLAVES